MRIVFYIIIDTKNDKGNEQHSNLLAHPHVPILANQLRYQKLRVATLKFQKLEFRAKTACITVLRR